MLNCHKYKGPWSHKTVTCGLPFNLDKYTYNAKRGKWGGQYQCPSGKVYNVADNRNDCRTLAGTGGEILNCFTHPGEWSHHEVACYE